MLFGGIVLAALLAASSAKEEDVVLRAEAAASACKASGGAPHPWDPQLLVLCADEHVPLTVVHCPPGTRASNETKGCQTIDGDDALLQGGFGSDRPARRRLRREGSTSPNVDPGCEGGAGLACKGCDKLLVCTQEENRVKISQTISCSSFGMACDKNGCNKDISCPSAEVPGFRCLQEGPFPDPGDCKRYHVCNEKLEHFTDTCSTKYDPDLEECQGNVAVTCTDEQLKCAQDSPGSKGFTKSRSFYLICLPQPPPNKGSVTSVMRCPKDQTFDDNTAKCSFKCPDNEVKRYSDPLDCHNFYECPGNENKPEKKTCSTGLGFDSRKKMCFQESKVKECSPATTTSTSTTTTTTTTTTIAPPPKIPPTNAPPTPTKAPPTPTKAPSTVPVDCPLFTSYRKDLGYCAWGFGGFG